MIDKIYIKKIDFNLLDVTSVGEKASYINGYIEIEYIATGKDGTFVASSLRIQNFPDDETLGRLKEKIKDIYK